MQSNQYPYQNNGVFVHPAPPPPYQEHAQVTTSVTTTYTRPSPPPPPTQYPAYPQYPTMGQNPPAHVYPTLPAQPVATQSHCVTRVTNPAPGVKMFNHQLYNTPTQTHVIVVPQQKRGLFSRTLNTIENTIDSAIGSRRHPPPATNKTVIVTQKNGGGSSTTVIRRY